MVQEAIRSTSKHDFFDLKFLPVKARFGRPTKQWNSTYTVVSAQLSITTAKRRDGAKKTTEPAQESRRRKWRRQRCRWLQLSGLPPTRRGQGELHGGNVGRNAPDPSAGLDSNVEPDAGIRRTAAASFQSGEQNSRVARHGSFQLDKGKMQTKETDLAAHLRIQMHLREPLANERSARSEAVKKYRQIRGTERRREKIKRKGQTFEVWQWPRRWQRREARAEVRLALLGFLLSTTLKPRRYLLSRDHLKREVLLYLHTPASP